VCIFEKRKSRNNFVWTINNNPLEVVNNFVFLGIKLSSNGKINEAIKALNVISNMSFIFMSLRINLEKLRQDLD